MLFINDQKLTIAFKDLKVYTAVDLQSEINALTNVAVLALAISAEDEIDNFMASKYYRSREDIKNRFGRRILVEKISHQSPTLMAIIISYKAAELILKYYNNRDLFKLEMFDNKNGKSKDSLLAEFIFALEILNDFIDNIS